MTGRASMSAEAACSEAPAGGVSGGFQATRPGDRGPGRGVPGARRTLQLALGDLHQPSGSPEAMAHFQL